MRAQIRPQSRLVSTSSAATTNCGPDRASADPGQITKVIPRVPWYSRLASLRCPMCESRPDSSAVCTFSLSTSTASDPRPPWVAGLMPTLVPSGFAPISGGCGSADRLLRLGVHAQAAGDLPQLRVQVLPLPDPQVVQVLPPAHLAEGVAGQCLRLVGQVLPQPEQGAEVRATDRRTGNAPRSPSPDPPAGTPARRRWPAPRRSPASRAGNRAGCPRPASWPTADPAAARPSTGRSGSAAAGRQRPGPARRAR